MKRLALGICDNPRKQSQPILKVDLLKSNIVIFGAPMSGKTTLVKSIIKQMHESVISQYEKEKTYIEENIYIIDFGGALGQYGNLCNVCACFDNSNEENIRRIFRSVEKQLQNNAKCLDGQNFVEYINNTDSEKKEIPHITLIIENVNSFLANDRYTLYQELLLKFCREGLSKGLTVILTASDMSNGLSRFLLTFNQKVAFELPDEKYMDIFGVKVLPPMKIQGRGIAVYHSEPLEMQAFLPFADESKELKPFIEEINKRYANLKTPKKLKAFKGDLTKENFSENCENAQTYEQSLSENKIVFGVDYYEHKPLYIDINSMRSIGIYGKRSFGKTNLLKLLVDTIYQQHSDYRFVFFDDGRKQLEKLHKSFPEGENNVYLSDIKAFSGYLITNGYISARGQVVKPMNGQVAKPINETVEEKEKNPFTVFVLQSKQFFQDRNLITKDVPGMIAQAEEKGYLFIYSDIRKMTDTELINSLNNNMSAAFVLDNISEFVADKGSKSVLGERDPKELKVEYAKCELGDGYYYDIEGDQLEKAKFIKVL
ncbi:MAG: hypothetical protein ACI4M3_00515 [Acutalibacteraceae bacterium]